MEEFFTELLIHLGAFTLVVISMGLLFVISTAVEDFLGKVLSGVKSKIYDNN